MPLHDKGRIIYDDDTVNEPIISIIPIQTHFDITLFLGGHSLNIELTLSLNTFTILYHYYDIITINTCTMIIHGFKLS